MEPFRGMVVGGSHAVGRFHQYKCGWVDSRVFCLYRGFSAHSTILVAFKPALLDP
jgi:hypothetical protein